MANLESNRSAISAEETDFSSIIDLIHRRSLFGFLSLALSNTDLAFTVFPSLSSKFASKIQRARESFLRCLVVYKNVKIFEILE